MVFLGPQSETWSVTGRSACVSSAAGDAGEALDIHCGPAGPRFCCLSVFTPKVHRTSGGRRQQEGQKVPTTLSEGTTVKSDLLTFCQLPFQKVRRCEKLQWDRISGQRHTVCHMGAWIAQSLQTNEDNTCSPMLRPLYVVLYVFRDQSRKTRIQ